MTFFGLRLGWRSTYHSVVALAVLALLALWSWAPRTGALGGNPVMREFGALAHGQVWMMMAVAALTVASIFAVYTFIGPLVTDGAGLPTSQVLLVLALFGMGTTLSNIVGGRQTDRYSCRGMQAVGV